tara:strand:+ start:1928 stop:2803 length:876 start_codon:yes stop_codon:yes gene_type:complete
VKKIIKKIFFNKKKTKENLFKNYTEPKINKFRDIVSTKKEISFLHYGHLGDIINCLPVIKELSKNSKCSLYIQKEKLIPDHAVSGDHPFGKVYLSEKSIKKFLPLLKSQNYLFNVEIFNNHKIDIDLNFFRELNINFNIDSVRWYSHLTGTHPDLSKKYLDVESHNKFKDYIVILRSLRRQNKYINYSFLNNYEKIVFVGLEDEFNDLKKSINYLEYHDSKDFLELASIIKNSKLFIGNLSFGYAIAEALKVPRLLESAPEFPLVYPNGSKGYDFYFQSHFEYLVKKLVAD